MTLPQNDFSPTRAEELAERRARFGWDHDYLPPFPFLKVPEVDGVGLLNAADLILGTFAGMPVEEQPSTEWLLDKTNGLWPVTYELMQQVSQEEWDELVQAVLKVLEDAPDWASEALKSVNKKLVAATLLGQPVPELEELTEDVLQVITQAAVEIGVAIEALDGNDVDAEGALEAYQRIADSSLDEAIKRLIIPLQALFRFIARKSGKRMTPPDGVVDDSRLTVELPKFTSPAPTTDDAEFAWRHVAGGNPVTLQHVAALEDMPSGFAVNDASLQAALAAHGEADSTLARAVAEGRLFLVDFAILEGLPLQEGPQKDFFGQAVWPEVTTKRYLPVPYALFYRAGDRLLTVAIQLGRDAAEFEVFTPADDPEVWRRVKTLYLCADFHHQELCTHLAQGHLRVDGFVIAMQRQLHQDHPLYALLKPFFYMHLWNDFAGRQFLYCAGGFLDQLLSPTIEGTLEVLNRRYPELTYDALHLPKWLKSRGLYDPDTLPVFPYRDDGLGIWGALRAFAGEYVDLYYASAEVMAADIELQAWLAELVDPSGADFRGLPAVDSPEALAELVTTMMFNSSAFHSAVNFSQFDTMARGIYTPSTTHIDPRTVRDVRWEDCLPGGETLTSHALIGWILVCQRSEHLTELDLDAFSDPAVWPVLARYRTALAALEAGQVKRNEGEWSYPWLLPSQVTQSASV